MFFPIAHREKYSINIYGRENIDGFVSISNIFHPKTIDGCFDDSGNTLVGGIKNNEEQWNLVGHKDRIIRVDENTLKLFAKLYDDENTPPFQARLPTLHSKQLVDVLKKFSSQHKCLGDFEKECYSTEMWHETNAQKDGTIRRETRFPSSLNKWVLSGPHFYVSTPFYKTPRRICTEKGHYDFLDLTDLPDDYLPRTNYAPSCGDGEYLKRIPRIPWGEKNPVTDYYRLVFRGMLPQANERTLIPAIVPKHVSHINGVQSTVFADLGELLKVFSFSSSILSDFFIKTTGRTNLHFIWRSFPAIETGPLSNLRSLLLNCITNHYGDLWAECWNETYKQDTWAKNDPRLDNKVFTNLTSSWNRNCSLRTHYERRQALIENDVLIAMLLGLTLNELNTIYRVQFPVLKQYESDTWYDRNGRIVFTVSKGLVGVGLPRKGDKRNNIIGWEDIKDMKSGTVEQVVMDDTLPDGPREKKIVYVAPFDRRDRENDYEEVWANFERRFGGNGGDA